VRPHLTPPWISPDGGSPFSSLIIPNFVGENIRFIPDNKCLITFLSPEFVLIEKFFNN
jgi:hypothetical protein